MNLIVYAFARKGQENIRKKEF